MNGQIARVIAEFYRTPWALTPEMMFAGRMILERWASGEKLSTEDLSAAVGDAPAKSAARRKEEATAGVSAGGPMVGVIPVFGVIGHRANLVQDMSSGVGTSTEMVQGVLRSMLADPQVGSIVLDIDSPGGSVYGVAELADDIFRGRAQKPIVAVANSLAASAAFWIGSAASEFIVTPGGEVGSIGVFAAHEDISAKLEKAGVKVTLISAGDHKVEANPFGPLGDDARAFLQSRVTDYYGMFASAVARYRGTTPAAVREGYGKGRTLGAEAALAAGMVDRVATFTSVIGEQLARHSTASPRTARLAAARARIQIAGFKSQDTDRR